MSWRKWKLGVVVAVCVGFFTACIAAGMLDVVLNLKFLFFFLGMMGKDLIMFLKDHPTDQITFDTNPPFPKPTQTDNKL